MRTSGEQDRETIGKRLRERGKRRTKRAEKVLGWKREADTRNADEKSLHGGGGVGKGREWGETGFRGEERGDETHRDRSTREYRETCVGIYATTYLLRWVSTFYYPTGRKRARDIPRVRLSKSRENTASAEERRPLEALVS